MVTIQGPQNSAELPPTRTAFSPVPGHALVNRKATVPDSCWAAFKTGLRRSQEQTDASHFLPTIPPQGSDLHSDSCYQL